MHNLSDKLDKMRDKLQELALKMDSLKAANTSLLDENEQLKAALKEKDSKVNTLKQQLTETQNATNYIVVAKNNSESSTEVKQKIDQYIKEIDKCIDWLSAT